MGSYNLRSWIFHGILWILDPGKEENSGILWNLEKQFVVGSCGSWIIFFGLGTCLIVRHVDGGFVEP